MRRVASNGHLNGPIHNLYFSCYQESFRAAIRSLKEAGEPEQLKIYYNAGNEETGQKHFTLEAVYPTVFAHWNGEYVGLRFGGWFVVDHQWRWWLVFSIATQLMTFVASEWFAYIK